MKEPAYPAARTVSAKVQAYFARHQGELDAQRPQRTACVPDARSIEAIVDAAFWTSLRREEGYVPRISLAFLSPGEAVHPLIFDQPLTLDPATLAKVAPAVERPGIHLGVWPHGQELRAVGITHPLPMWCFVCEVT